MPGRGIGPVDRDESGSADDFERFMVFKGSVLATYDGVAGRLHDKPYFVEFRNILCARTRAAYSQDGVHLKDVGREMGGGAMAQTLKERLRSIPR